MADDVEIEFTAGDLGAINFGEQDFFAGELRAGKEIAEGIHDAAAAAADDGSGVVAESGVVVSGIVADAAKLVSGKNEAAMWRTVASHESRQSAVGAQ